MAMIAEIRHAAIPTPQLISVSPQPGETLGDLEGVYVQWSNVYDSDPLDIDEFVVKRDGVSQAVSFVSLGGGLYKVFSDVGLFPDQAVSMYVSAKTELGYKGIYLWTFATRPGSSAGEVAGAGTVDIASSRFALSYDAIVEIGSSRFPLSAYTLSELIMPVVPVSIDGSVSLSQFLGYGGLIVLAVIENYRGMAGASSVSEIRGPADIGSSGGMVSLNPGPLFSSYTTIELIARTYFIDGASDIAIARLSHAQDFDELLNLAQLQIAEPKEEAGLLSVLVEAIATEPTLLTLLSADQAVNIGTPFSLEVDRLLTGDAQYSVVSGLLTEIESMMNIEVESGSGVKVLYDLLSALLSKARD